MRRKKSSHNKKRNTAFLFETLVIECTKASLNEDYERGKKVYDLVRKNFTYNSELLKDLHLYQALLEAEELEPIAAEKLLQEVKRQRRFINKEKLFVQQRALAGRIRRGLGSETFNHFMPGYKSMATIAQILDDKTPVRIKIVLEEGLIGSITGKQQKVVMEPIDNIVYKTFVKKFNERYGSVLSENQQKLISLYVMSLDENLAEISSFLDKELGVLKKQVKKFSDEYKGQELSEKLNRLHKKLDGYKDIKPDDTMITEVLKTQELIKELQSGDHDQSR